MVEGGKDLLGEQAPATVDGRAGNGGVRGGGRPKGALNQVNRDLRAYLVGLTGKDAIVEQYKLASVAVLTDEAEIIRLSKLWSCDRVKVIEIVGKAADRVFPHIYPRLGSLEIQKPGAPGNPIEADDLFGAGGLFDGEWTDITPRAESDLPDEQ